MQKVLIVHVPYEHRGGEDVHVDALIEGYQNIGVMPIVYPQDRKAPREKLLERSLRSLIPSDDLPELQALWDEHKPRYVHLHNVFPVLGPRFFRWSISHAIPLVMTVHNHRFFCTNGLALRNKKICKDCFHSKHAWRPLLYNCNGSWTKSIYHSLALTELRRDDLYGKAIQRFVAPSPYLQAELVRLGLPKDRVVHILNPVFWDENDLVQERSGEERFDVLYAGRLSHEKGIYELISAIRLLPNVRFVVAGDGPERASIEKARDELANLTYLGPLSHEGVLDLICQSKIAALPSICNETLSTFALEVFFQGKRCVVPALDSTSWLASGDFPGMLAKAGDPADLARAIEEALKSPKVTAAQRELLQKKLGFKRFCADLKALWEGIKTENK